MSKARPNSRRNLDMAIERVSVGRGDPLRLRTTLANAIVGQMLPGGAVKGGGALKLRYGDSATRFTRDLDTARTIDIEPYIEELERNLERGWNGFTGHVVPREPAKPKNVPERYVMQPYRIKLEYNRKPWLTVELEVGHNEIGDADDPEPAMSSDIAKAFVELGFPVPEPIGLMPLHYQIAQKLHALTEKGSARAHDLVDLQVILANSDVDLALTRQTCVRLFAYRNLHQWPPLVQVGENWETLYDRQAAGLDVLPSVEDAVVWANDLVDRIDAAES